MYAETEGIVLKQTKTINGRRMVLLFSRKYGKISAGTSLADRGKSGHALALRPFTLGKYGLYKNRDTYNISSAEVLKAYYKIGEDIEKYMCASFALEFAEKLLPEEAHDAEIFKLLLDFFDVMESRKKEYMTAVIAFQLKAVQSAGAAPEVGKCVRCGEKDMLHYFSVTEGGTLCRRCQSVAEDKSVNNRLIYSMEFDIVEALRYFLGNSFKSIEHIALNENVMIKLREIAGEYCAYHLGIKDLLSGEFLKSI